MSQIMDHIQHTYPLPHYPAYANRIAWRLPYRGKLLYQLPEDFIDMYIGGILGRIRAVLHHVKIIHEDNYLYMVLDSMFFISFDMKVLAFLKLHRLDFIPPIVRESVLVSLRRNSDSVEMDDLHPYLAVVHKIWLRGSSLTYFMQNRVPAKKFNRQKCVRKSLR